MTTYLLDVNVIQEMHLRGNREVQAWARTVADSDLRISAVTILERRLGRVAQRKALAAKGVSTAAVDAEIAALDALAKDFADRTVVVDADIVKEWTELLGAKQKNMLDMALAATARVHDLVIVTGDEKDFVGRGGEAAQPLQEEPPGLRAVTR